MAITTPDDLLLLLSRFQYLTIQQIVKLLGKETSINYVRGKMKHLVDRGLVEVTAVPRNAATGKLPFIYSLTKKGQRILSLAECGMQSKKSGIALEHTLSINDVAILAHVLPQVAPGIILVEMRHESVLKKNPVVIDEKNHQGKESGGAAAAQRSSKEWR